MQIPLIFENAGYEPAPESRNAPAPEVIVRGSVSDTVESPMARFLQFLDKTITTALDRNRP
ncbi:MAG TPA: hypothetical protein VF322_05040 [Gammaproteobacteria bacterium]